MSDLSGRVAIVTGSTSGIGAETARHLAAAGVHVVVNSSTSVAEGEALAASLPTESIYVQADISDEEQDLALVASGIERFGQLDILVNNAGWTARVPHDDLDALTNDILTRTFEVNVYGTWWLTRAAMPHLKASDIGNVVNITSVAGLRPVGSSTAYGMAKAALNMLTLDLAKNCGPVRVNAIAPGLVDTPWSARWPDMHAHIAETTPAARSATPADVAAAVIGCVTNTYMTGAVVVVDGGLTLMI